MTGPALDYLGPGTPSAGGATAREAFAAHFGYRPDVVARAPGRVNLMGEHTDYNRGLCLPIALPHATYAALGRRPDQVIRIKSNRVEQAWSSTLDELGPDQPRGWWSYVCGVLWAMRNPAAGQSRDIAPPEIPGTDIFVHSTVPLGAGLSSSAALEAAVAVALWSMVSPHQVDRTWLAEVCVRAETEIARAPTGGMDQAAALLSTPGRALLIDFDNSSTTDVDLPLADHGLALVVIDSGVSHALVDGSYGSRRAECAAAAKALSLTSLRQATTADLVRLDDVVLRRRARHVVTEIARVDAAVAAITAGDYHELGRVFAASHTSLRDDFEVSCAEVDAIVDSVTAAGALGARMTGGGFGGSAVAIVDDTRAEVALAAVTAFYAAKRWAPPRFLKVTPSPPAALV
ncbi:MAG: galactokinase [Nocardioides sp.]